MPFGVAVFQRHSTLDQIPGAHILVQIQSLHSIVEQLSEFVYEFGFAASLRTDYAKIRAARVVQHHVDELARVVFVVYEF